MPPAWRMLRGKRFVGLATVLVAVALSASFGAPSSGPSGLGAHAGPTSTNSAPLPLASAEVHGAIAAPTVSLLASLNESVWGSSGNFPLNFTVPSGTSHALYVWAFSGNYAPSSLPSLPAGMRIETLINGGNVSVGVFAGMALGALSPGTYSTLLNYSGYVGVATVAVYGISNDAGFVYVFGSEPHTTTLTLPAGASVYLGVETSAGTYPISNASLTTVDVQTPAMGGGVATVVGRQSSDRFSFATTAVRYAVVAVGITSGNGVTFDAAGLPANSAWSVTVNGSTYATNLSSITVALPNGSYPFSVSSPPGFLATPRSGTLSVAGGPLTQTVAFRRGFNVTFTEAGFPASEGWSVVVNGSREYSTSPSVTFVETNGSFSFSVPTIPGFLLSPGTGTLTVNNSSVHVSITGIALFPVTFGQVGLPTGVAWEVVLNGMPQNVTGGSVAFPEPNGTYEFSVRADDGYAPFPNSSTVVVNGVGLNLTISFTAPPKPAAAGSGWLGLPGYTGVGLLGWNVVVTAGLIGALIALRRARRSRNPPPITPTT